MALSLSDLPTMYTLLSSSLSADHNVRKPAEAALSQSENRPGFFSCLMEVITAKDLASQADVRLLASVYFKNSIKYWRNRRESAKDEHINNCWECCRVSINEEGSCALTWQRNGSLVSDSHRDRLDKLILGISKEEKIHLRQKLLSHLREENYQIALTLAVLISKIARIDYPKEWPELFSVIAQQLQCADILSSHRIFMILFRTIKELSTKRLTSDQKTFAEISSHFFDYSWSLWQHDLQTIMQGYSLLTQVPSPNTSHDDLYLTCERWLLCIKIIRQLVISGFTSDAKSMQEVRPVKEVCPIILNAIQSFLPYYSSFRDPYPRFWNFIKRACTKLMKVIIVVQIRHPYSFGDISVLPPVMDFCLNQITAPNPEVMSDEQFVIQCMKLVKSVLECKEYKPSLTGRVMNETGVTHEQLKKNVTSAVADVITSLLPKERVVLLCNVLIRRYFVLTSTDLEEWHQNPESFYHEQDSVLWSEKLRPCSEALYIVLFENYSQLLGPVVVSILQEAMAAAPTSVIEITPGLLLKEAAYGATAYVYYELSNYLSFKEWFNGALSMELGSNHSNMRIIRRKVALILGQWVSEIKEDTRRPVYCAIIKLLQDPDLCVRLAATRSLCFLIEDANFGEKDFSDLLPHCWDLCFKLVEDVHELDSKVQVLNSVSILLAQVGEILPYASELVRFFQKAWEESSVERLLQIQLLTALKNFVSALGFQSPLCYNMLLPILRFGIDVDTPDELLEDSILLWEATVSNAPSMVPQLLEYFPSLLDILERNFDHLKVAADITEGYIVLGGNEFLQLHASNVARLLDLVVGNVNNRGLLSVFPVIDVLIQCFPSELPSLISSTLQKLIVICLSGGEDHDPSNTSVKTASASILARILVTNTNFLAQLTSEPSLASLLQKAGVSIEENILLSLVDVWLDKVDSASIIQRRAFGLALSIILTLRLPQVLDKLDQILSVCTSVILGDSKEFSEEESSSDNSRPHVPSKEFRKRQVKLSDPIYQLSLENCVRDNLQTCATLHGESFNSAIGRMDPTAFAQIKQALKMS